MKNSILPLFILISCTIFKIQAQIPTDNLVGFYNLDNLDLNSETVINHPMQANGDLSATSNRLDQEGKALSFDSGYISLTDPSIYNFTQSISISFWLKFDQVPTAWIPLVNNWNGFNIGGFYLGLNVNDPNNLRVRWNVNLGGSIDSSVVIPTNEWVHLVATYGDETATLYMNGIEVGTESYPGMLPIQSPQSWHVGIEAGFPLDTFNGEMDEILFYDRVLTQEEVITLFEYNPTLNIDDINAFSDAIVMYPNPTTDNLYVTYTREINNIESYMITDITGKVLLNDSFETNNSINISNLETGIYNITFISKDKIKASKKIIKK